MSGETLLAVQKGKPLGNIDSYDPKTEELLGKVGELNEGVFPEKSILASSNTHAYIATRYTGNRVEEIVIALKKDDALPRIDIGVRVIEPEVSTDIEPDPELLLGALKVVMRGERQIVGVVSEDAPVPDEVAKDRSFNRDAESGELFFTPGTWMGGSPPDHLVTW